MTNLQLMAKTIVEEIQAAEVRVEECITQLNKIEKIVKNENRTAYNLGVKLLDLANSSLVEARVLLLSVK